ncbi:MAG TPA: peptidoglycan-binding domain-containing protein [Pyrinomonadaceae bacterium]|nr:peptidoglycan-binding domain-containing protein [Pyrinomonadaceae bacterium]
MAYSLLSLGNRQNDPSLVRPLKAWLNAIGASDPRTPLPKDAKFDRLTDAALRAFQRTHRLPADGVCGICTWQALSRKVIRQAHAGLVKVEAPAWLLNLLLMCDRKRVEGGRLNVDRELFMAFYRAEARHLGRSSKDTSERVKVLGEVLSNLSKDQNVTEIRSAAEALAGAVAVFEHGREERFVLLFEAILRACLKN